MSVPDLILVGNYSASCHVGAMLGRGADSLGLRWIPLDLDYARSLRRLAGRGFFRLSGGRPVEWWSFNRAAAATIRRERPRVVLITGVVPLHRDFFAACREAGARVANFATDDPWAGHMRHNTWFVRTIPEYDLIASTKPRIVPDLLGNGARRVECFTYAYDPTLHRLPDPVPEAERAAYRCDLSFIGTGTPERRTELEALAARVPGEHHVYGNSWARRLPRGWRWRGEALDNRFRLAAHEARISIALLRRTARDDATMRTFELAPCGACGLYEDTKEQRTIFTGYPDLGFFDGPGQLADRCRELLASPDKQAELRESGRRIIATPEHTYATRLQTVMRWLERRMAS